MALIADGYEIALHGTTAGRPWTNVFHFELLGGTPPDPNDAAQIVCDAWGTTVFDYTSNTTELNEVSWVDLRTVDGSSGSAPALTPYTGGNSAQAVPPQVCVLIQWSATGGRAYRNGRTYVPGIGEGTVNAAGVIDNTQVSEFTTQAGAFIDACATGELGLAILSRLGSSDGIMRTVTSGTCSNVVATQRRRVRG